MLIFLAPNIHSFGRTLSDHVQEAFEILIEYWRQIISKMLKLLIWCKRSEKQENLVIAEENIKSGPRSTNIFHNNQKINEYMYRDVSNQTFSLGVRLLTETGEDSELAHRQKRPKVDASIFLLFFCDASERRV